MALELKAEEEIEIPEGLTVEKRGDELRVSGENGELVRTLSHPKIHLEVEDDKVKLEVDKPSKSDKALLGTYRAHINNMIKGAQEDFIYKLKIIYSHFPMEVTAEQDEVVIKNFVGENKARRAKIRGSTKAQIDGDEITIRGPNKEDVAQTTANIESATKISGKDPRVFQDGIYLVEKTGKSIG